VVSEGCKLMSPMISKGVERRERIDKMSESSVKKSVMSEFGGR
jgi:hypothetical protein